MAALAIATAACGNGGASPSAPPTGSTPTGSARSPSLTPPVASASPTTSAPPASSPSALVAVDPALLELLPLTLDGLARQTDASIDAPIAFDANLARIASAFATALYIDPPTSQFAYASVVRLLAPLSDAAFRDYRDSYDEGACQQAGGVTGHAEGTIGDHATFVGTCAGGVRTYHVKVRDGAIVVSVAALGDRGLGEKLVAGLGD